MCATKDWWFTANPQKWILIRTVAIKSVAVAIKSVAVAIKSVAIKSAIKSVAVAIKSVAIKSAIKSVAIKSVAIKSAIKSVAIKSVAIKSVAVAIKNCCPSDMCTMFPKTTCKQHVLNILKKWLLCISLDIIK